MFEVLSPQEIRNLLEDFLHTSSKLTGREVENLLRNFPFREEWITENLNYLAFKVFRARKDLVDRKLLSERLGVPEGVAEELLGGEEREVLFPVASGKGGRLARALVVPLESTREAFSPDPLDTNTLRTIAELAGMGFFVVFDTVFDYRSSSYSLALFSALKFWGSFGRLAFTGVLTPEGSIEGVEHLDEKREVCRREGVPLLFPSSELSELKDLEAFMRDLLVPVGILPPKEGEKSEHFSFLKSFRFGEDYLREVFFLEEELVYRKPFEETVSSFEEFAGWLDRLSRRLKELRESCIPFRVGFTSKVVTMSFLAGVRFSKARLPVLFFMYKDGNYELLYEIESDREHPVSEKADIRLTGKRENPEKVRIHTKADAHPEGDTLAIRTPSGEELDRKVVETAGSISSKLRTLNLGCPELVLETSNALAFALGYFLEDYKCFTLTHKGKPVYILRSSESGRPPFLLNAFSLNMLSSKRAIVKIDEIPLQTAREILREGFESYVSHASTAKVLEKLLGREVPFRRDSLKLENGDSAVVFQLRVRPSEGKVFSEEELSSILENELYTFYRVEVYY